ncbi:MAG TPA: glycosyltransferase family 4 protein [Candidatus Nanoarchaeia archaeon]|nr:glycosyltransferase family 4 protein [Candidatus Nanoarchaeia archaeon]
MRILHVFGGIRTFKIANWQSKQPNVEAHKIAMEDITPYESYYKGTSMKIHTSKKLTGFFNKLKGKKLWAARLHLLAYPFYINLIAKVAKENNIDLIHAYRHTGSFATIMAKKLFGLKQKVIFDYQDPWSGEEKAKTSALYKVLAKIFYKLEGFLIKNSDFVITQGQEQTDILAARHKVSEKKFDFTWNTVDENRFNLHSKDGALLRKKYGLRNKDITLLYSGSIVPYYGIHIVPEAMKEIIEEFPNVKFAVSPVVRDVAYWNSIKQKISDYKLEKNFVELKPESLDEIPKLIAMCDIGLITHMRGSYVCEVAIPTKLFEYMACGLTIVTSDMKHLTQFVLPENCGLAYIPNDAGSLAAAIRKLLSKPSLLKTYGHNSRKAVEKTYNWDAEMKKVLKDYYTLVT